MFAIYIISMRFSAAQFHVQAYCSRKANVADFCFFFGLNKTRKNPIYICVEYSTVHLYVFDASVALQQLNAVYFNVIDFGIRN